MPCRWQFYARMRRLVTIRTASYTSGAAGATTARYYTASTHFARRCFPHTHPTYPTPPPSCYTPRAAPASHACYTPALRAWLRIIVEQRGHDSHIRKRFLPHMGVLGGSSLRGWFFRLPCPSRYLFYIPLSATARATCGTRCCLRSLASPPDVPGLPEPAAWPGIPTATNAGVSDRFQNSALQRACTDSWDHAPRTSTPQPADRCGRGGPARHHPTCCSASGSRTGRAGVPPPGTDKHESWINVAMNSL